MNRKGASFFIILFQFIRIAAQVNEIYNSNASAYLRNNKTYKNSETSELSLKNGSTSAPNITSNFIIGNPGIPNSQSALIIDDGLFAGNNNDNGNVGLASGVADHVHELAEVAKKDLNQSMIIEVCDANSTKNYMIYCTGDLLKAVNIHKIYSDSKTFVDMPLKEEPEVVYKAFHERFNTSALDNINRTELIKFLDEYFMAPGTELEKCDLNDWSSTPPRLMNIRDSRLRKWALELNQIWKKLCRKMKPSVDSDRHSLIYVPYQFIVPGGRFREFYYWDTYWIIKGLLASGMHNTTKSMLLNFRHVVEKYGFVPNGGRVYYLKRSQPPLLAPMVYQYYEYTHDKDFLKLMLPMLEKELNFWHSRRKFNITGPNNSGPYEVFFYHTESNVPRPESYREDINVAKDVEENRRPLLYRDLASAAESGWDFSSRWFADRGTLKTIKTTSIAPIDLNALLCWNMQILEYFFRESDQPKKARIYTYQRLKLKEAIRNVFYNRTMGAWFDYDTTLKAHNLNFYPSVAIPLFGSCYQQLDLAKSQSVFNFMNYSGVFDYPGGVPTSKAVNSTQQWDFPNGFPPLQHMIIEGMRKSGNPQAQEEALEIAQKWVEGNYKVYKKTGAMWEKYDVSGAVPQPGQGGEYSVQDGFGWTNGVILDLLTTYSYLLKLPRESTTTVSMTTASASSYQLSYNILTILLLYLILGKL